jgi:hypothetical protein
MNHKPPVLPVLTGVGTIGLGLLNGLICTSYVIGAILNRPPEAPPVATLIPGLLALADACALVLIPAGVGILLHRPWGKQLATGMSFGATIVGLLGAGVCFSGIPHGYPDVIGGAFAWSFLTGLLWAITLAIVFRASSMKAVFS